MATMTPVRQRAHSGVDSSWTSGHNLRTLALDERVSEWPLSGGRKQHMFAKAGFDPLQPLEPAGSMSA